MMFFNRIAWQAIYLTTLGLSIGALPFSKKLRKGFIGRKGLMARLKKQWGDGKSTPIWFHFASSGELEQAIPIAEEIKRQTPKQSIFFTYFSPSGERGLEFERQRRLKAGSPLPWDYADYCPLDLYFCVKKTLQTVRPKQLILINREIWPELLIQCHLNAIPSYLFVSYFPPHKSGMLKFWKAYLKLFRQIGLVGRSSEELLRNLLPEAPLQIVGDTRIERVLKRKNLQKQAPSWAVFFEGKKIFLAASVWPEDFKNLKPTLEMVGKDPNWRILIVPHEPKESFIKEIKSWAESVTLTTRRFSQFLQMPDDEAALIVDRVGLLAELYQFSKIAFVGGSFKSRIHNVLEPAAYGNAIVTGPFISNSFEATEMSTQQLGLRNTSDPLILKQAVQEWMQNPTLLLEAGLKATQYLEQRRGAAVNYVSLLNIKN